MQGVSAAFASWRTVVLLDTVALSRPQYFWRSPRGTLHRHADCPHLARVGGVVLVAVGDDEIGEFLHCRPCARREAVEQLA